MITSSSVPALHAVESKTLRNMRIVSTQYCVPNDGVDPYYEITTVSIDDPDGFPVSVVTRNPGIYTAAAAVEGTPILAALTYRRERRSAFRLWRVLIGIEFR